MIFFLSDPICLTQSTLDHQNRRFIGSASACVIIYQAFALTQIDTSGGSFSKKIKNEIK